MRDTNEDRTRESDRTGAQMIQRGAALLRLITAHNRGGMRLVDLYKDSGLTRPTTHRILQALVAERIIRQDARSKRYFLGPLAYEMGLAAASPYDLRDVCQPYLVRIAEATGDTVFLTLRSGFDAVCAGRAEGAYPIKAFVMDVGRRRPLNIGGGAVALLSGLQDDEIERIYQANSRRIASGYPTFDVKTMWEHVRHARSYGYLVNEVLEIQGVRSLAMPIFGSHGAPVAALSISALNKRLCGNPLREKVGVLQAAAHEIQARLHADGRDGQVDSRLA